MFCQTAPVNSTREHRSILSSSIHECRDSLFKEMCATLVYINGYTYVCKNVEGEVPCTMKLKVKNEFIVPNLLKWEHWKVFKI